MGTKMKGLIKGLRYISQIFENEKEPEMQIGYPTDVKHVAHIGWDGPSVDSPSWMKEFPGSQSAPLNINQESKENPEIKWVSGDSSRRGIRPQNSPGCDSPDLPRSSSRRHSADGYLAAGSPTREPSSKQKPSSRLRRHSKSTSKESCENTKPSGAVVQDPSLEPGSPSRTLLPDIPKKSTRRKKTKESSSGSMRTSRSKAATASSTTSTYTSPFSDPGAGGNGGEICQHQNLKPLVQEEEKGRYGIS